MSINDLKSQYPHLHSILGEYYQLDNEPKFDLNSLISDKLGNIKEFSKKWVHGMLKSISRQVGYPAQGLTFGFVPNYGGMFEFSESLSDSRKAITQIQFYLSLIKNVYSIQIVVIDSNNEFNPFLKEEAQNQILNEIWISPNYHESKYNEIFKKLEYYFEKNLKAPIFLPYSIQKIELLDVLMPHTSNEENTVEDAFFRKVLPLNKNYRIFGDENYRIDELQ